MAASFRVIDYRVRTAKQIERRMVSEALTMLRRLHDVSNYRYVGFGAIAFQDFIPIHRVLGISDLISIERSSLIDRIEFNRPFGCIRIMQGSASQVVDELEWDKKTIIWLDYDGSIRDEYINDIGYCVENAPAGSVIMVTMNAESGTDPAETFDSLKRTLNARRLPQDFSRGDLAGRNYAKFIRRLLSNEIQDRLHRKNQLEAEENHLTARQFLNFSYRDGARMVTLGWVVQPACDPSIIDICGIDNLPFYRNEEEPYTISPPILTPKEINHLNSQLPCVEGELPSCPGISDRELGEYADLYRYYPLYYEVVD